MARPSTSKETKLLTGSLIRIGKIKIRNIIYLYFNKNDIGVKSFFNFSIT